MVYKNKNYTQNYRLSNTNLKKLDVNSGASGGYVVPVPLVSPVVLLL